MAFLTIKLYVTGFTGLGTPGFIIATGEEGAGVMPMCMRLVKGVKPNQAAPRYHQFYGAS